MSVQINKDQTIQGENKEAELLAGRRFLTARQTAQMIGKHYKWLERKRWEGGGPAFRYVGKSPIYEEQDVIEWMKTIPKITNTSQSH